MGNPVTSEEVITPDGERKKKVLYYTGFTQSKEKNPKTGKPKTLPGPAAHYYADVDVPERDITPYYKRDDYDPDDDDQFLNPHALESEYVERKDPKFGQTKIDIPEIYWEEYKKGDKMFETNIELEDKYIEYKISKNDNSDVWREQALKDHAALGEWYKSLASKTGGDERQLGILKVKYLMLASLLGKPEFEQSFNKIKNVTNDSGIKDPPFVPDDPIYDPDDENKNPNKESSMREYHLRGHQQGFNESNIPVQITTDPSKFKPGKKGMDLDMSGYLGDYSKNKVIKSDDMPEQKKPKYYDPETEENYALTEQHFADEDERLMKDPAYLEYIKQYEESGRKRAEEEKAMAMEADRKHKEYLAQNPQEDWDTDSDRFPEEEPSYERAYYGKMRKAWKEFKKVKDQEGNETGIPQPVTDPKDYYAHEPDGTPIRSRRGQMVRNPYLEEPRRLHSQDKYGKRTVKRNQPVAQQEKDSVEEHIQHDIRHRVPEEYVDFVDTDAAVKENMNSFKLDMDCPMCGSPLYSSNGSVEEAFCPDCDYNRIPHEGSNRYGKNSSGYKEPGLRKAWEVYINMKKQEEHPDPDAEYDALREREHEDKVMGEYKNSPEYNASLNYQQQLDAAMNRFFENQKKVDRFMSHVDEEDDDL